LIVITSRESSKQFEAFKQLVGNIFKNRFDIEEIGMENFESVERLFNSINQIYEKLNLENYRDKDIIIDITGGQKPNSIAAALMTIYYRREFQYISTKDYKVKSYDINLTSPPG